MIACLLTTALASEPTDLREALAHGVVLNWTEGVVEVEAGSYRTGAQAVKAVEQSARLAIDERIVEEVGEVPVTGEQSVDDLLRSEELGAPLRSRRSRWRVVEAIYAASGKVDLRAELSLQEFLKPYTLAIAVPTPPTLRAGDVSGVIIDARGTGARPVFAPAVMGSDGQPLWRGELYDEDAVSTAPCRWVPDPAHPAAALAGDSPMLLRAQSGGLGEVVLGPDAAARLRGILDTTVFGRGRVVVVVDP